MESNTHRISKDALFIIDGSYLLYRSFFGLRPLHTSTGMTTQAVYGFIRTIKKLIDMFDPQHMVVVWDSKGKNFRHELYEPYKAQRQAPPSDLFEQKELIIKFLKTIHAPQVAQTGFEADDIIGGLTERFHDKKVVLVCADKDMYQLLSERVLIFDPFKDRVVDEELFRTEQGFESQKVPFFYALLGDASDNIPGVEGIGKKTAQELVCQFDSLHDLYANIEKVAKERTRTLLTTQKDNAELSLKLFTLKPPALEIRFTELTFDKEQWSNANELFTELEFTSLIKKGVLQKPKTQTDEQQVSLFGDSSAEVPKQELIEKPWTCYLIDTQEALDKLVKQATHTHVVALDTETTGPLVMIDELVGISIALDTHSAYYIPVKHKTAKHLDRDTVIATLKPWLEKSATHLIMHHAKFDHLMLWKHGIELHPVAYDTIIAANLVRNEWQKINLKDLSAFYLHEPMQKFKDLMGKKYKTFDEVPLNEAAKYAAYDALQTLKLMPYVEQALDKEPKLKHLYTSMDMPFYMVLTRMEQVGVTLDPEKLAPINKEVTHELDIIEKKILSAIDQHPHAPLNLNSPKQIETLLFDRLGLPVIKKSSKGARSTDQEVLEELSKQHPIPGLIIKHRELAKLKNTYLDPLPGYISPLTGRVHTSYSQTMVTTGRLSSTDPNLQNIPVVGNYGIQIRSAFVAPHGKLFLSADYSQIELRILAHLSKDPALLDIFKHNRDIHTETTAQLLDIPLDQITHEQRQLGKRINFSIMYGISPFGLAKDLDIKQSDAKMYIERYFARYAHVAKWIEKTVYDATEKGYTETLFGRRRHVPELREKNRMLYEAGKRVAINSPVQGTQSDIMKLAMIKIDQQLIDKKLEARMILQIHDEIILELPHNEQEIVEKIVRTTMESIVDWEVPLNVSISTGNNWGTVST